MPTKATSCQVVKETTLRFAQDDTFFVNAEFRIPNSEFSLILLHHFTVPFEGIGFVTQMQSKAVALVLGFNKREQSRAAASRRNNQARGTQIQRTRVAHALRRKDPFQWEKGLKRSFASNLVQKNEAGIAQLQVPFLLQFGQNAFDMHGVFQVFIQNKIQFRNLTDLKRLA